MNIIHFLLLLIPSMSSANYGEVVIRDFSTNGYILKTRPFLLYCTAHNAASIRFRCGNKWIAENRQETKRELTEEKGFSEEKRGLLGAEERGLLRVETNVSRADMDGRESINCECYATGIDSHVTIRSNPARVAVAYMRKHFLQSATSQRVREGSTVAMPCVPPEADPKPLLEWLKDGLPLVPDGNLIVASDGSLLLSAARLSDQGSFSCQATNIAGRRLSSPSFLQVYVDGDWSQWGEWGGSCSVDCRLLSAATAKHGAGALPRLTRRRTCNNPAPINGGMPCNGDEEETRLCELECAVDGRWSEWQPWSVCSAECENTRLRSCTEPAPLNAGRQCAGLVSQTQSCSVGVCSSRSKWTEPLMVTTLLALLVLIVILMGLCVGLLMRRPKQHIPSMPIHSTYYGDVASYQSEPHKSYLCDDRLFVESPVARSTTLRSSRSAYARCESGGRGSESRAALLADAASSTASSGRKALLRTTSSLSEENNYATVYECAAGGSGGSLADAAADTVVAARVDSRGARLSMHNCSTSLLVPEGSFPSATLVFLTIHPLESDLPLHPDELPLSSIVSVSNGPLHSPPRLPVVVSLPHCAFSREDWELRLYADVGLGWQEESTMGDGNPDRVHLHIDTHANGVAHCITNPMSRLLLAGRPRRPTACKRMRIVVYSPYDTRQSPMLLRVHIVPEGAGVDSLRVHEEKSRLIAESPGFALSRHGALCFCLEDLPLDCRASENYIEIGAAEHDWCSSGGLECSFTIYSESSPSLFSGRLLVMQKDSTERAHTLQLMLNTDYEELHVEEEVKVSTDFRVPLSIRDRLCQLLDPMGERDWRSLARSLRAGSFTSFGICMPSPTAVLLALWEARREEVCHLAHALRLSGRPDAAIIVEKFLP